jgi:GT2 family glycosyltransferase
MLDPLDDESVGIVGSRLLYPDGSIQHDGMRFCWDAVLGVWLNEHPGKGFDPLELPPLGQVQAVTGACLAIRADLLERLGGFDEGFLVGDFEDSTLCIAAHNAGKKILIQRAVPLVHAERQSISHVGKQATRDNIVIYNAWRNSKINAKYYEKLGLDR